MDFRIFIGGFLICLQSIVSITSAVSGYTCRLCEPGFFASRMCSSDYDTVCKRCSFGTFSTERNTLTDCEQCSKCNAGEFVVEECSKTSDTKCAPCDSIKESYSHHFRTECLQGDDPRIHMSDSEGITLHGTKEDKIQLHENSKENIDLYESSSAPEGSGVDSAETDHQIYSFVNITGESEEEDESGEGPIIEPTLIATNATTVKAVLLPDNDTETDGIVESTTANVTETTTVRSGVIIPKGGIDIDAPTERPEPEDVIDEVFDVYVPEKQPEDDNKPHTGASKKQNNDGGSGGASVGVVVTVGLVTAFVFFVLGFLASRVWNGRRERSFNVLEAERRNGKPPVECSGIEYKDPENNITKAGRVYTDMPVKANGSGTEPKPANTHPHTASAPPIYTKPITRSTELPTASQPKPSSPAPKTDKPVDNWAGFALSRNSSSGSLIMNSKPERPASEIKYIDEVSGDEAETETLLPPATSGDVANGHASRRDSATGDRSAPGADNDNDNDNVETAAPNENTPMLANEPNHQDS